MNTVTYNSAFFTKANDDRTTFSKANVGGLDRVIRTGLASVLLMDVLHGTGPLGLEPYFAIAAIPLIISAIMAWDPLYALFDVRTVTLRGSNSQQASADRLSATFAGINVGAIDRLYRVVLASLLIATPFLWVEAVGMGAAIASIAGIAVMMTAIMGWDPLYHLADVRTATLKIVTAPQPSYREHLDTFELYDEVQGDDVDILQKAA